jgi:type VI secretion system protein ImpK
MSSKDDPFGPDGKTAIEQAHGPGRRRGVGSPPAPPPNRKADSTVLDPTAGHPPIKGAAAARTVLARGQLGDPIVDHRRALTLDRLFEANEQVDYQTANPILAAAAPVLMLLGHLRQIPVEVQPGRLAAHLAAMMQEFDRKVAHAGVGEADGRVALYVLCETVDDIVQNLPGLSPSGWLPQGMLSRFFRADAAGVGFFDALNRILADPEDQLDLLAFMHACMSLGFEGQYRRVPEGAAGLDRVRRDVYETLRYFRSPPGNDISPQWQGVPVGLAKPRARIPIWAIAAAACALVAGAFFEMRRLVTEDGEAMAAQILHLDPPQPVAIQHVGLMPAVSMEPPPVAAPVALPRRDVQLERVRTALAAEIAAGKLTVDVRGQFIVVEINNLQLFRPGRATLRPEFEALIGPVAAALSAEPGPIRIVGHTDSEKPGRGSAFKSNFDLSVARARAVEKLLSPKVANAGRIQVEGKGEDEAIADNATPEGRARNRRVDLMIAREDVR